MLPKDLGDGLYLAAVGMGVVFLCLVALMLVLIVLKKLFPGEEVAESAETDEAPAAVVTAAAQQASEALASVGLREPSVAREVTAEGRAAGAEVAAMAVAKYLALEQQEQVEQPLVVEHATAPAQEGSRWSTPGSGPAWGNQGRRPPPYGQKSQSAYPPKDSVRE